MNSEFWQARWQEGRIGFHQSEVNPLLIKYINHLDLPVGSRIFVPLCGKSIDMVWLAEQGHEVVGVELVESAVQEFFAEHNISPTIYQHTDNPANKYYQGQLSGQSSKQTITLWVADIFALAADDIGAIDAVYDRAALIALPADTRPKYSDQIQQLSHHASQLLLTLNYDQNEWAGPPFSISPDQILQYYSDYYQIAELEGEPATLNANPEMTVTEHVWLLDDKRD
ncbi:thiopurine S-methyltransferase [Psychrobacter sp. FBL11]|uniref:Thiopurine S-methyltransferase n=1 Tax=Psychrobacter saeujeotis TaxID=3143436 RepID=A0ABU9XE70_9GAMM|nr:thiopurine S-methyltransferase [uncultured Psychrobacter sp.]